MMDYMRKRILSPSLIVLDTGKVLHGIPADSAGLDFKHQVKACREAEVSRQSSDEEDNIPIVTACLMPDGSMAFDAEVPERDRRILQLERRLQELERNHNVNVQNERNDDDEGEGEDQLNEEINGVDTERNYTVGRFKQSD